MTHEVCRRQLAVTTEQIPDTVSGQVVIEVPIAGPPSLNLANNQIVWSVQVCVQVPDFPDDWATFILPVPVLPVLAAPPGRSTGRPHAGVTAVSTQTRLALDDNLTDCGGAVVGTASWSAAPTRVNIAEIIIVPTQQG